MRRGRLREDPKRNVNDLQRRGSEDNFKMRKKKKYSCPKCYQQHTHEEFLKCDIVTVIVTTRDARQDRLVPRSVAKALYDAGKLAWDLTNGEYCVPSKLDARGIPTLNPEPIPEITKYRMKG